MKKGYFHNKWLQICAIITVSIVSFNAAVLFNWTSPTIPVLISPNQGYHIDLEEASYLTVIPALAMIMGSPFYTAMMNKFGRKYSILTMAGLHLTAWMLIAFSKSIYLFYLSRAIYGLGDACLFAVVPIYIAEVSEPKIRTTWGNSLMFSIYFGQFVINAVGYFCSIPTTAFIFATFPCLFLITFSFMPESPYFYAMKKECPKAKDVLEKLTGSEGIDERYQQLICDVQRQLSERGTFKDLFRIESNRRAMFVCTLVRAIQQFGGVSAFAHYTQYIFQQAGQNLDSGSSAMIYTGALAIFNLMSSLLIDKLGRRISLVISSSGCTVALFAESIYFYLRENNLTDLSSWNWFPIFGMILYVAFFSIGLGIVPTVILGELFSVSVKAKACFVMNIIFAAFIGLSTKLFQVLSSEFGFYVPFALFGCCTLLGVGLSYFFVPETTGKTLEEIQQMLKSKK